MELHSEGEWETKYGYSLDMNLPGDNVGMNCEKLSKCVYSWNIR